APYRAVTGAGGDDECSRDEAGMPGQARQAVGHAIEKTRKAAPPFGRLQQAGAVAPEPFPAAVLRNGRGIARPRRRALTQRSSEASSTIHLTSSSNVMPEWAASSGTSDVSVMPGWVLTSRQTKPS